MTRNNGNSRPGAGAKRDKAPQPEAHPEATDPDDPRSGVAADAAAKLGDLVRHLWTNATAAAAWSMVMDQAAAADRLAA